MAAEYSVGESEMCRVLPHKFGVVQAQRTSSNLLKMNDIRESAVCRVFSHRTSSNLLTMNDTRESEVCRVVSHKFGVVQAHRTSSNLLKRNAIRESEVCTVFS